MTTLGKQLSLAGMMAAAILLTPGTLPAYWEPGDHVSPYIPGAAGDYVGLIRLSYGGPPQGAGYFHMTVATGGRIRGKLNFGSYTGGMENPIEWPIVQEGQLRGWSGYFLVFAPYVWSEDWEYSWDGWDYTGGPYGGHGYGGTSDDYIEDFLRLTMQADMEWRIAPGTILVSGILKDAKAGQDGVVTSTWSASMDGRRAGDFERTKPAPHAGAWTLVIPGGEGNTEPAGAGFATVTVDPRGKVSLSGFLADGSPIHQKTLISRDGQWPLFARLYKNLGSVAGWIDFTPGAGSGRGGLVVWIQPPRNKPPYASGFVNTLAAEASPYTPAAGGSNPLGFTDGIVVLSGAGLPGSLTNSFHVDAKGRIVSADPRTFSLKLVGKTGLFQGSARTASGKSIPFKGAQLQSRNCGYGYFLNENKESGLVYLGSWP